MDLGDYDEFGNYVGPALEEEDEEDEGDEGQQQQVRPLPLSGLQAPGHTGVVCRALAVDGVVAAAPPAQVEQP